MHSLAKRCADIINFHGEEKRSTKIISILEKYKSRYKFRTIFITVRSQNKLVLLNLNFKLGGIDLIQTISYIKCDL